jgi:Sortase and related acyltransferases
MALRVEPIRREHAAAWHGMRGRLGPEWLEDAFDDLIAEYFGRGTIQGLPHAVFFAWDGPSPVGFAEVSLRPYAEGCLTSPVGYLKGWFVDDAARGLGVGRALLAACEHWARGRECREFASDAETDNAASIAAHERLGFETVCEIRCFRKDLG